MRNAECGMRSGLDAGAGEPIIPSAPFRFLHSAFRILLALALATGCTREDWHRGPSPDDAVALVPWFATMKKGPAVQPYSAAPREPVPGTVPVTGTDPELHVDKDEDLPAINRLRNPAPRTSESLEQGRHEFEIYCYPCHGSAGLGDGPVTEKFPPPPNLTEPNAKGLSDGYIYSLVRYGRGIMPPYGDKVRGMDRWHLVNYIRLLQGIQGATPAAKAGR
jgi:hypothetical protein